MPHFSQKQEKSGILSKNSKCDIIHRRKTKRRKIMQKAWKKKSAVYVPFVVLFLVELWIHKGIVPDFGDDLWFKEVACSEGFHF